MEPKNRIKAFSADLIVNTLGPPVTTHYYLGNRQVAYKRGDELRFPLDDHLYSSAGSMDADGNKVARVKYFPFGGTRFQEGDLGFDKMFTGQRLDQTGLYFYNARYYDATIGRFISPDTIVPNWTNPQSLNRYSYCLNNPLRHTDPSGHQPAPMPPAGDPFWDTEQGKALSEDPYGVGADAEMYQRASQTATSTSYRITLTTGSGSSAPTVAAVPPTNPGAPAATSSLEGDGSSPSGVMRWIVRTLLKPVAETMRDVTDCFSDPSLTNLANIFKSQEEEDFYALCKETGNMDAYFWYSVQKTALNAAVGSVGAGPGWRFGSFKSAAKWESQMARRGWTEQQITDALTVGEHYPAVNNVNPANTATRYIHPETGQSVVIDDVTKEVLHVGGPGFRY